MHSVGDMRRPRSDRPDTDVDLVYAGLKCHKVVSIEKDSYIKNSAHNQIWMQPDQDQRF